MHRLFGEERSGRSQVLEAALSEGAADTGRGDVRLGDVRAGLEFVLPLTLLMTFAACGLLIGSVLTVVHPNPVAGLGFEQRQGAETALYLLSFGVVLPTAVILGPRVSDAVARGPNGPVLSGLIAAMSVGFLVTVLFIRLAQGAVWNGGPIVLLAGLGLWSVAAVAATLRAVRAPAWPILASVDRRSRDVWVAAGALLTAVPLAFVRPGSLSLVPLVVGAAAVPVIVVARRHVALPQLGHWGRLLDLGTVGVLLLVSMDLVILEPEDPSRGLRPRFIETVSQFHADFLLGPANQVLEGGTMLVDTVSQYGVGLIYFLTGWFHLVPIGYGTLGFLDGIFVGLSLAAGYAVLRISGCSRALSAGAMGVAVAALVLNRVYPVGVIVQEGPLRFGHPMIVVTASVVAARWPRHARPMAAATLITIGVASLWSVEAFALTLATWCALTVFQAQARPRGARVGAVLRQAGLVALACVIAQISFALATLVGSGELPHWDLYFDYLTAFAFGDLGDVTYDFSRWSPGLGTGAVLLASAASLAVFMRRQPALLRDRSALATALVGTTAYGIFLFMYVVDRSGDHVVAYTSLPALLAVVLWLHLVLSTGPHRLGATATALAVVLSAAVVLVSVSWASIGPRLSQTALAYAVPGAKSARSALDRLWSFPAINRSALDGERLLTRYMPGERRSLVIVGRELSFEILMRSGRSNVLPWADPWVVKPRLPGLRESLGGISEGDRLLTSRRAIDEVQRRRHQKVDRVIDSWVQGSALGPLEIVAMREIRRLFRFEVLHRGTEGYLVVRLVRRS